MIYLQFTIVPFLLLADIFEQPMFFLTSFSLCLSFSTNGCSISVLRFNSLENVFSFDDIDGRATSFNCSFDELGIVADVLVSSLEVLEEPLCIFCEETDVC